jgi:hypothetical protein
MPGAGCQVSGAGEGPIDLPNRRECWRVKFRHAGIRCFGTLGVDPESGRIAEIFLQAGKAGTAIEAMARDGAVLSSLALQAGVELSAMGGALTRLDDGNAAGPLGELLDAIADWPLVFEPPPDQVGGGLPSAPSGAARHLPREGGAQEGEAATA